MRVLLAAASLLLATPTCAEQAQPDFNMRLPAALRNDLAVILIKLQQTGLCDVPCHLVVARALVAIDVATPVQDKPETPGGAQ